MLRSALAAALLFAATFVVGTARTEAAETVPGNDGGAVSLEDRLKTGLRVKAPHDVRFVETVAQRVREGRMPAQVVDSTYLWAVSRGKKYPFPAFEHVIRLQAAKLNVAL